MHRRGPCALPPEYYASGEILRDERRLIMRRQWTYAGHMRQLRRAGDFLQVDAGGESVVVARDEHDQLHAFRNECRHRRFPFCEEREGRVDAFVCPYHSWTYALDGRLLDAAGVPSGPRFDYRERGLLHVAVEAWRDLVFVCASPQAPPSIGDAIDALAPELSRVEPERLKPAATRTYEVAANWKLLLEHHPYCASRAGAHAALERVLDLSALREPSAEPPYAAVVPEAPPLREGMRSASRDGGLVSRPLDGLAEGSRGWTAGLNALPGQLQVVAYPDHVVVHALGATRVDRSLWTTHWLVHEDAEEGVDYVPEELVHVWDATITEHVGLVERTWSEAATADAGTTSGGLDEEPRVRAALKAYVLALEAGTGA